MRHAKVDRDPTRRERDRVLLVEDSDEVRLVLSAILQEVPLEVVEARNGFEGLDKLRTDPRIGLVFLDMFMPGMDGLEMLRAMPSPGEVPVVLLTGDAVESVDAAKQLGVVMVLQKPVRTDTVLRLARKFVEC